MEETQRGNIVFYFHLGETLHQLTDASHADIYGEHILKEFEKRFNAQGQLTLAGATLKYARQFYRTMERQDMMRCLKAGIVWNNIKQLIGKRVTDEMREQTIKKIEAGEVRQAAVKTYLDEQLGTARRSRTVATPLEHMSAAAPAFDELMQKINGFGRNAAKLFRGSVEDYEEAATCLDIVKGRAQKAWDLWKAQLAMAETQQKKNAKGEE